MQKYKLINKQTGEEHLCDKVTIDGFDYYVSDIDVILDSSSPFVYTKKDSIYKFEVIEAILDISDYPKIVIATNNPNIDCPQIVDEVEKVGSVAIHNSKKFSNSSKTDYTIGFIHGYNKSQETHSFSEEDMFEFVEFVTSNLMKHSDNMGRYLGIKKVLQIWKKERPIKVYYEKILY